jgi:hypothetical protein
MWKIMKIEISYPMIEEEDIDTCAYPISIDSVYLKYRHQMANVVLSRKPENTYVLMGKVVSGNPDFTKRSFYDTLQEANILNVSSDPENIRWVCKQDEYGDWLTKENADHLFMHGRIIQVETDDLIVMEEDITQSIKRQILDKVHDILINECNCSVVE